METIEILFNTSAAEIKLSPFPHIIKNQMFTPELYQSLKESFPSDKWFSNQNIEFGGRQNLRKSDPKFKEFINQHPAWKSFYDQVNSEKFLKDTLNLFGDHINAIRQKSGSYSAKFVDMHTPEPTLAMKIAGKLRLTKYYDLLHEGIATLNGDEAYVDIEIFRAHRGYSREIHTDNPYKIVLFLVYFNSMGEEEYGGDLGVFSHKDKTKRFDEYERFPKKEDVELAAQVSPGENNGAILLSSNNSYHNVSLIKEAPNYRNSLYISICTNRSFWRGRSLS